MANAIFSVLNHKILPFFTDFTKKKEKLHEPTLHTTVCLRFLAINNNNNNNNNKLLLFI